MPGSRIRPRRNLIIAILVFVALGVIVVDRRGGASSRVRTVTSHVFAPSQSWLRGFTLRLIGRRVPELSGESEPPVGVDELQARLRAHEAHNAQLAARNAALQRRVHEIGRIADDLAEYPLQIVPAGILSRDYILPEAGLRIDAGSAKGIGKDHWVFYRYLARGEADRIEPDEPVVNARGICGVVEKVGKHVSQVRLITSDECHLSARIMHWNAAAKRWVAHPEIGVTKGTGDGKTVRLLHVPVSVGVRPGDYVVTEASRAGMVEFLIVGEVIEASHRPTDLTHRIIVQPRVDLDRLDEVYVLTPRPGPSR